MIDLQKAVEFVSSRGSQVEQARLNYLLSGERPSQEVVASLFAGQRSDGGWSPFWAQDYSSLDATCFRLAQAEQLGIPETEPAIRRAVHFLAQRQYSNGSWEEDGKVAGLTPPWAAPGDLSAKLYLTANCGLWLALLGNPGERASKAGGYLKGYLDQDGHLPGFLHTYWLAGGLWHKLNMQETSKRIFEHLSHGINDLPGSNLAWLITTLCAAGVRADYHLVEKAASLLEHMQQEDGRWQSEDGPAQDIHATLEALRALSLTGRVLE